MSSNKFVFKGKTYTHAILVSMSRDEVLTLRNDMQQEHDTLNGAVKEMARIARSTGKYENREKFQTLEGILRAIGRGMLIIQTALSQMKREEKSRNVAAASIRIEQEKLNKEDKEVHNIAKMIYASSIDVNRTVGVEPDEADELCRSVARESIYAAMTFMEVFEEWRQSDDASPFSERGEAKDGGAA